MELEPTASAVESLWLLRHVAQAGRRGRPLPRQVVQCLRHRRLSCRCCCLLLTELCLWVSAPLELNPPCATWRSRHEQALQEALLAVASGHPRAARQALDTLIAPGITDHRSSGRGAAGLGTACQGDRLLRLIASLVGAP